MLGRFLSVAHIKGEMKKCLFVFFNHYSQRRALVLMIPLLELKLVF